jgi:hypothetical protein
MLSGRSEYERLKLLFDRKIGAMLPKIASLNAGQFWSDGSDFASREAVPGGGADQSKISPRHLGIAQGNGIRRQLGNGSSNRPPGDELNTCSIIENDCRTSSICAHASGTSPLVDRDRESPARAACGKSRRRSWSKPEAAPQFRPPRSRAVFGLRTQWFPAGQSWRTTRGSTPRASRTQVAVLHKPGDTLGLL